MLDDRGKIAQHNVVINMEIFLLEMYAGDAGNVCGRLR